MVMATLLRRRGPRAAPRGAASLIVVMVLFFIIAMVAAYTSRNLVFEQRTAANQYRATLAFEAAEAGLEWAVARLNDSRMADNCVPLANAAAVDPVTPQPSFRERYLSIDAATGVITPVADRLAGCVFNGSDWSCDCPSAGNPNPTFVASGDGPYSAFWVRFTAVGGTLPGVVRIEVNGCTRNDVNCLRFDREAQFGDGLAAHNALLVLRSALGSVPLAALTVRGATSFDPTASTFNVTNDAPTGRGITVHSGPGFAPAGVSLNTIAGSPASRSVVDGDPSLALADLSPALTPDTPANYGVDRMFNSTFGVWPATFAQAPGVVTVPCAPCSASAVNDAVLLNPGHAVLLTGAGPLTVDADIGSPTQPVVIVAGGSVEFTGTPATIHGLVYSRAATWTTAGTGTIRGAAVAESNLDVVGNVSLVHDGALLTRARVGTGSFIRAPGGWRDTAP